jgi:hypothetical protein
MWLWAIVTDRLRSYRAAMKMIGSDAVQVCARWLNNPVQNSSQPFRRREAAMVKFRGMKTLQKFASVRAPIHNHFEQPAAVTAVWPRWWCKQSSANSSPPDFPAYREKAGNFSGFSRYYSPDQVIPRRYQLEINSGPAIAEGRFSHRLLILSGRSRSQAHILERQESTLTPADCLLRFRNENPGPNRSIPALSFRS